MVISDIIIVLFKVMQILGNNEYTFAKNVTITEELRKHREVALQKARLEADLEHKDMALKKTQEILSKVPDLDVEKVWKI